MVVASAKDYYEYRIVVYIFLQYYMMWLGAPSLFVANISPIFLLIMLYQYNCESFTHLHYYVDLFRKNQNQNQDQDQDQDQNQDQNQIQPDSHVHNDNEWELTHIDENKNSNEDVCENIFIPIQYQPFLRRRGVVL